MGKVITAFSPQINGLRFANRFKLIRSSRTARPLIHPKWIYGLCGGMCFTALDFFYAGASIPEISSIEEIRTGLFLYLWRRQLDSMSPRVISKTISWMLADDRALALKVAREEVPRLRRSLDAGRPAVLVLIRVKGFSSPTRNHQVAAVGYDLEANTGSLNIYLYDPNHPWQEPVLSLDLANPERGISMSQSTGEPLRAFFLTRYTLHAPPEMA